jgi:hypothetical protein
MQITPRQFMESINAINEILISAYSLWHSVFDNGVEIFSLQLSKLVVSTHYERVIIFASDRVNRGFTLLFFFLGDEAVTASYRRLEPPTVQPRRTEYALAKKSRVFICKSELAILRDWIYIDSIAKAGDRILCELAPLLP